MRSTLPRHRHEESLTFQRTIDRSVTDLIASIKIYLRVNKEHHKRLIWHAGAESILTKVQRGRVAPIK